MRRTPQQFSRVLVIGAGTLGQIYGAHLSLHGVDVSYLVRSLSRVPRQLRLRSKSSRKEIVIESPKFLTVEKLKEQKPDAIFVTTRTEDLAAALKPVVESFSTVPPVFLFCPIWSEAQIPHRKKLADVYYLMPGVAALDEGGVQVYRAAVSRIGTVGDADGKKAKDMAFLIQACGLACRFDRKLMHRILQPSMAIIVLFALIEIYHGRFRDVKLSSVALQSGLRGLKEAVRRMGEVWGVRNIPLSAALSLPEPVLRLLVWALMRMLPRFYREMLAVHAHKISKQTRLMMDEAVRELGEKGKMKEFEKFVLLLKKGDAA